MAICTCIKLKTVDQRLTVVQQPVLASGDVGTVRVEYALDSYWDGYTPSGTFYNGKQPEDVYEQLLDDGACVIPWEVLQEDGVLYIGLRGVDAAGLVKTAAPVRYRVEKGSPRGNGTTVEPTPDVYQSMLTRISDAESSTKAARRAVVSALDGMFTDGVLHASDLDAMLVSPVAGEYKYMSRYGNVYIRGYGQFFSDTTWTPKSWANDHYEVIGYRLNFKTGEIEAKQWTNVSVTTIAGYRSIRDLTDGVNLPIRGNAKYHDVLTALILIPGGATEITADMIEDLRGDKKCCGYVTSLVCTASEVPDEVIDQITAAAVAAAENAVSDKAPAHTYSTEDITAGSASTEPEGTLHFVIE